MKHKESTEAGGGVFAPTKPIKEGLVSQIASKFQNNETVVLRKKSSTSEISPVIKELPKTSVVASVSRTESHQARFNSARAMFEKMGSADDLDSISSSNGNGNRGSRASSVQRSRSTSPFNTKVNPVQPPRSPETPDTVSLKTGSKERVFNFSIFTESYDKIIIDKCWFLQWFGLNYSLQQYKPPGLDRQWSQ